MITTEGTKEEAKIINGKMSMVTNCYANIPLVLQ